MAIEVHRTVTINRPRDEVYSYWRQIENLPRFMKHLESVTGTPDERSHWVALGPAGVKVEWDAESTADKHGELIAWKSIPEAQIPNTGEVRFQDAPAGRGTEVHVHLTYNPPGGAAGAAVAKLLGGEPDQTVREDLRRFKRLLETGEIATTDGQPSGRPATVRQDPNPPTLDTTLNTPGETTR